MRNLIPLVSILLVVAVWSWNRREDAPLAPADCSIHGIHVGDSEQRVVSIAGQPSWRQRLDSNSNCAVFWERKGPRHIYLTAVLTRGRVTFVRGDQIRIRDLELKAGDPLDSFEAPWPSSFDLEEDSTGSKRGSRRWKIDSIILEITSAKESLDDFCLSRL